MEVEDAIAYCREFGIYVNVLGLPIDEHQHLAAKTGGKWHVIPEERQPQVAQRVNVQKTPRSKAASLRRAQWADVTKIGSDLLQHGSSTPVDIVLFVDSSKSMDDKLPYFLQQLDIIVRDWDNAFIDYQVGVVRFRSRASVNIVNVFNPPQTLEQIRKIVELPCQENEMLLDAVAEGLRRLKLRPHAQPYFILITDEPADGEYSSLAIIKMFTGKTCPCQRCWYLRRLPAAGSKQNGWRMGAYPRRPYNKQLILVRSIVQDKKMKIAVLVSGSGTNLQTLIEQLHQDKTSGIDITVVISDRRQAYALTARSTRPIYLRTL